MKRAAVMAVATSIGLATMLQAAVILDYEAEAIPESAGWTIGGETVTPYRYVDQGVFFMSSPPDVESAYYRTDVQMDSSYGAYTWSAKSLNYACESYIEFILRGPVAYSIMMIGWDSEHVSIHLWPDASSPNATYGEFPIAAGMMHSYGIEASGAAHTVLVDGTPRLSANLQDAAGLLVTVQFGYTHVYSDISTNSQWDYIRIVTPDPAAIVLMPALWAVWMRTCGPRGSRRRASGHLLRSRPVLS